jgi:hypothetical protein
MPKVSNYPLAHSGHLVLTQRYLGYVHMYLIREITVNYFNITGAWVDIQKPVVHTLLRRKLQQATSVSRSFCRIFKCFSQAM